MSDVYEQAEGAMLNCKACGHWKKGTFTRTEIVAWLRIHGPAGLSSYNGGLFRESTCPNPCGGSDHPVNHVRAKVSGDG